jgi:WD40 repeat protein
MISGQVKEAFFMFRSRILAAQAILGQILCTTILKAEPVVCKGHTGMVLAVTFTPDGKKVISGGIDRMVRIWDAANGKQIGELQISVAGDPEPWVSSLAVSSDGKTLAVVAGHETPITFWNLASGTKQSDFLGADHGNQSAWGIAFSPDDSHFAAGGPNGLQVWDLKAKKTVFTAPINISAWFQPRNVAFAPDGMLVAADPGVVFKWATEDKVFSNPNIRDGGSNRLCFRPTENA